MVDTPDLKSVGRMPVGVRVPPPAPSSIQGMNVQVTAALENAAAIELAVNTNRR